MEERIIRDEVDAFLNCDIERIDLEENNSSVLFDTQVVNNDDDNKTYLFTEEASSVYTSQSIREVMMTKFKGYNSLKTEYNEVFIIATKSESCTNKWVYLLKWLIKQHLNALS